MKPPRKSSLLHRVVVHLLYKHRKEKTIQTEDERSLTRAFLKRIIYLFDRYSVSKKSVCGGLFRQNTFPLLANIGVLRAGRALPLYLLTPAGRPGKRAGKPCRARLPNPPQMSARQAARWKRAACPALARVSFSKSKIWRRNRGFGIQLGELRPSEPP